MDEITYMSAAALAEVIRKRQVSSKEVVERYVQSIEQKNPRINAVVQLAADAALAQAEVADAALARNEVKGPLHGVPVTIKDNLDTAGIISTGGTQGRAYFVPEQDATVVARLKEAGAIVLGKTNTPELTLAYETDNIVYGRTNNPYDPSRTCGGSSGGSAAILAIGGSPLDIGSDTGGSLRVPSHYCGTAAIRPTSGRVSRAGHILPPLGALESLTTIGPMARYVDDLALTLPIISGADWRDPAVVPMPLGDYRAVDLKGLRVAVHTDNGVIPPSLDIVQTVNAAAKALADAGAIVTEKRPEGIDQAFGLFLGLLGADNGAGVSTLLHMYNTTEPSPFIVHLGQLLADYAVNTAEFDALLVKWGMFKIGMLAFMQEYDLILSPVTSSPAVSHGATFTEEVLPGFSYTATYNLTGWPAAVVRCGTSEEVLPIGVQVIAAPWREDRVLAAARHLETVLGGWQRP